MTGRARLISNELVDRATADGVVTALQNLLDPSVWSIIHPDLKTIDDGFYDYPELRRDAVSQALQLLSGERVSITKPIIVHVLRHSGLFVAGGNEQLQASEVANEDTQKTLLAAVKPNYQGRQFNFINPIMPETPQVVAAISAKPA